MSRIAILVTACMMCPFLSGCVVDDVDAYQPDLLQSAAERSTLGSDYLYSGYDDNGLRIIVGILRVVREDSTRLSGSWELRTVSGGQLMGYGPQLGSGKLEGGIEGSSVYLNLNPNYVDNNVLLVGTISNEGMTGRWEYVGFPGVLKRGTFVAVRSAHSKTVGGFNYE